MKRIVLLCLISIGFQGLAQLEPSGPDIQVEPLILNNKMSGDRSTSCANDTILYNRSKLTSAQGISINNQTSAHAFGQYFNCPQPITIHGAQFVAFKTDNDPSNTIDVQVMIFNASLADSLPIGAPVITKTITIDTINYLYNIDSLEKTAMFDSSIVMDQPFLVVVQNNSPDPITMYGSSYTNGDGQGEYLGCARIGFNWSRGYNINVGGTPFDADMLFYPIVSYDLDAEFSISPNCDLLAGTDTLKNLSSPISFDRFYSMGAYDAYWNSMPQADTNQFIWDYGDGSPLDTGFTMIHNYAAGVFDAILYDTLVGWTTTCADSDTLSTCYQPASIGEGLNINFNVYPNPTKGWVEINSSEPMKRAILLDMSGKLVREEQLFNQTNASLYLNELGDGLYMIRTELENGQFINRRIQLIH